MTGPGGTLRVAVVADIHGNSAALDAVLADIATTGADLTVNLGDCLSGPLDATGTAERLLGLGLPTVAGNHDRALIDRPPEAMGSWERPVIGCLTPPVLAWLHSLPATLAVEGLFLCHGTPVSDTEPWLDRPGPDGLLALAPLDAIDAPAAGVAGAVLLSGHTHIARAVRLSDGRLAVNPGSVGCPAWADRRGRVPVRAETGAPDARYALLERRGGRWQAALRAVPYDARPMVALARAAAEADWDSALTTGRVPA
ncbi:MAG: metallophosphatase family protein [Rhodobacteraceae bacterium]|jgi:predicted phosphodiesterase|nr:metallophosphatase family protein [Paracoccaceae bacterium]